VGVAIDGSGNYIVSENWVDKLSMVTPSGVRTVIYSFTTNTAPVGVAIDGSGNYIVAEYGTDKLSMVTPSGVRTVIYSFPANSQPMDVAIDGSGNYIVTTTGISQLSKITPSGVRTVIHDFGGVGIAGVAVDGAGNYIVAERDDLSMITPSNVRTVIYSFVFGTYPMGVAIDSSGNYIVAEKAAGLLSMITPSGVRTVIYDFGTQDAYVAVVPGITPSGYSAVIWGWDVDGWIDVPITMDGADTGFSTPHTFTISGTHTFSVPSTAYGYSFGSWDTGETSTTLTVSSGGTHTAQYLVVVPEFPTVMANILVLASLTLMLLLAKRSLTSRTSTAPRP
jgi:hypothetical protein